MSPDTDGCDDLRSPNVPNFVLSLLIVVGILISYLPQHIRLVARRSSEGISPYFILLGTTSGTCAFANVLTIPASRHALSCCRSLSGFECTSGLLGILQIGVQWACFAVILFLFILFFPRATPLAPPSDPDDADAAPTYRLAISVFTICIIHLVVVFTITILLNYIDLSTLTSWAYFLGILGTVLAAIQFLPQIWTTWKLQAVRSLSIPMMCIQTPGSFVWVGSLAARLGWAGWSTWGIYMVTGVLQGCLLAMGLTFEVRDRRKRMEAEGREEGNGNGNGNDNRESLPNGYHTPDERTRLLDNT